MADLTGKERVWQHDAILIAIRDDQWTGVLNDSFDNDPVYYEHHDDGRDESAEGDGFVERGHHYVIVAVTNKGVVSLDCGYHKEELPARAFVLE